MLTFAFHQSHASLGLWADALTVCTHSLMSCGHPYSSLLKLKVSRDITIKIRSDLHSAHETLLMVTGGMICVAL